MAKATAVRVSTGKKFSQLLIITPAVAIDNNNDGGYNGPFTSHDSGCGSSGAGSDASLDESDERINKAASDGNNNDKSNRSKLLPKARQHIVTKVSSVSMGGCGGGSGGNATHSWRWCSIICSANLTPLLHHTQQPTTNMFNSPQRQWARTFASIKAAHDEAYRIIERAIKLEERERPDLALKDYKNGIRAIDEALAIPVEIPDNFQKDESWNKAVQMIHKMKCTRGEVLQRIGQIGSKMDQQEAEASKNGETAAAAREGAGDTLRPRTYSELAQALREMQCSNDQIGGSNSLELLFSCDGVKMYYIEPDGVVSRTLDDSTLRIVRIEKDDVKKLESTVFLQIIPTSASTRIANAEEPLVEALEVQEDTVVISPVEEHQAVDPSFIYPLIPGVSPCYRTEYGAFIIPDLTSEYGRTIGLVVPPEADDIVLEIFIAFLHGIVSQGGAVRFGIPREKRSTSATVSANIIKGAYYASQGLVKGAEKTGEFISYSTPYLISKIRKSPEEGPAQVPSNVKTGIEIAKSVTGTAVSVTSYVAGKVGCATMALGRFLAPHIQKHGSDLLSYSTGISAEDASEKVQGALTICAGAVEGFGTVYAGLEKSASILGSSLSNSTVQIVQHKYGPEAGQVVGSSLDTVGNVINVSHNMNYITPKGLAKRTAKNAGKALVAGYRPPIPEVDNAGAGEGPSNGVVTSQQRIVPAAVLYPDLSELAKEIQKGDKA